MAVHGDIIEITYNNPDIGSGTLQPKANEGNTFDIGGFRNNDDANMVTGSGSLMIQKNRVVGFIEAVIEDDGETREDMLAMTDVSASNQLTDWTFTTVSGETYGAKGVPVGDLQKDVNAGTFTLKVVSQGKWKKIA